MMQSLEAVQALSALAQENRLAIFRYLIQAGPEGVVVGQIADALAIPSATLSFHLKTLQQAALIQSRQQGRFIRYTARFDAMHDLIGYLSENCCGSDAAACAPVSSTSCKECS